MTAVDQLEAKAAPGNDPQGARAADFEAFFTQEHVRLFRALCLLTKSLQEAEEFMQDAFLKLWERWDRASAMDSPTGYLYRTAMNLVRSRARRVRTAFRTGPRRGPHDGYDITNRPAVALEFAYEDVVQRMYFDPTTYQLMSWTSSYQGNQPAWVVVESGIVPIAGQAPESKQWLFPPVPPGFVPPS
jgi:hypothetical protein